VARARPVMAALAVALGALALVAASVAYAAFGSQTQNEGDVVTAAPDFRAPVVTAALIGKPQGGVTGAIKQGGSYYVYANVAADTGNPASGTSGVKANASAVTAGATAVELAAGSYTTSAGSFNYRSAALTADASIGGLSKSFTVSATDNAGNVNLKEASVEIDKTVPTATDIQTTNGGTTNGLAEQNDTVSFSFSEAIEPESVLAGWGGATTNVVVRVNDNGLLGLPAGNDTLEIWNAANTATLPLGAVDLGRSDYAAGLLGGSYRFGATGTASKMTMTGSAITVVLGTYNSTIIVDAGRGTAAGTGTMVWTPVATPYDRAANALSTTPATETGAADKEF
jgi:hypothetical protein